MFQSRRELLVDQLGKTLVVNGRLQGTALVGRCLSSKNPAANIVRKSKHCGALMLKSNLIFAAACAFIINMPAAHHPCLAQAPATIEKQTSGTSNQQNFPVAAFGREVFSIHSADNVKAAREARDASFRIEQLVYDQGFSSAKLAVKDHDGSSDIVYGDKVILSVGAEDALAESMSPASLARQRLERIKSTVDAERARRNFHEAIDQVNVHTFKSNLIYVLGNPLLLRGGIGLI